MKTLTTILRFMFESKDWILLCLAVTDDLTWHHYYKGHITAATSVFIMKPNHLREFDKCFHCIKCPCKARELSYIMWIIFSSVCLFLNAVPQWIIFLSKWLTEWNDGGTWAESNKIPFQIAIVTSLEVWTHNRCLKKRKPNLSGGSYIHSSLTPFLCHTK